MEVHKRKYRFFSILIILLIFIQGARSGMQDLIISEVCPINDTVIQDEMGGYPDWIELYNTGSTSVNLSGLYLSDNRIDILKWKVQSTDLTIAPGAYLILWADNEPGQGNKHIGFKLSEGEFVLLYNPTWGIIDSVSIPIARPDISIGRDTPNKISAFKYFKVPTPGTENNTTSYHGYAGKPIFDKKAGFYSNPINVSISKTHPDETIYYTLNNYDPEPGKLGVVNTLGDTVNITSTMIVRARCMRDGYLPGPIVSNIYIMDESYTIPVMATITDPDNLTGTTGIYSHPWNEGVEWERFAQHQYFIQKTLQFNVNSGIRIQGGNSVGMPKKAFRHHYKTEYGNTELQFPLFHHSSLNTFKHIVMRSGYDDDLTSSTGTLLRDPLSSELWRMTGNLASATEFSILYLNTDYWGIYNVRESLDEEFIKSHLGTNNFDMIRYQKNGPELKYGSWDEWNRLDSFVLNTNFNQDDAYNRMAEIVDMDNLLNLLAFVHCAQYRSWTWGSSAYKEKKEGAKWRWSIWDTDRAYTRLEWNGFADYNQTYAEKWANYMPQALINNTLFKNNLINRTADFLNKYFKYENVNHLLDSLAAIIQHEVPGENERWSSSYSWESKVDAIRNFLSQRPSIVRDQIMSYFSINNTYNIQLNVSGKGKIIINSLTIREFPWDGIYFENIPVSIKAIPEHGFVFEKWSTGENKNIISSLNPDKNTNITAYFIPDTSNSYNITFNEIMYNPSPTSPSEDWVEIYNSGEGANISGWWLTDSNPFNRFYIPQGTYLNKDEYLVIAKNQNLFSYVNPDVENVIGSFGESEFPFGLAGNGDCIKLYKYDSILIDSVEYDDASPWPVQADGFGSSLQLLSTNLDNNDPGNWKTSIFPLFTPGSKNIINNSIGIEEQELSGIMLVPNPYKDHFKLYFNNTNNKFSYISIYSINGNLKDQKAVRENVCEMEFNTSDWNPGMYILKINSGNETYTEKLIKY